VTMTTRTRTLKTVQVKVPSGEIRMQGILALPEAAKGLVMFAHGSGSSRLSPRNQYVAGQLNSAGFATLLFDLLTDQEEKVDDATGELRFNCNLLARRLSDATGWIKTHTAATGLPIGYFGASTGAAAALLSAATRPGDVKAVVSRGGRPDLATEALPLVQAPTLLIVGGLDDVVIDLNRKALAKLTCEKELSIVPGATHLFEEPGTLERAAELSRAWFAKYLE